MTTISGSLIKGYELIERIGAGGFGAVYRAKQSTVGREVAVKVILPSYANQPDFIRRFETEAQLVARLEHMHIVPLYDYWRDPEGAYLVMRLLRGGSLQGTLQAGPLDLEAAAKVLDQVAAGLALAHRSQIVHRDIKPSNILLDEDGNAYLTDFGIAKVLNLDVSQMTQGEGIIGSPDYLAPEQARSEPITPQTDIYSMGVVLYEMLTGDHPFKAASTIERLFQHINEPLPLISGLDPDVTEGINRVIQTATTKKPDGRFRDILEMANAFREAAGLGISRAAGSLVELLTPREQEVLKLLIEGRSNRAIAEKLVVELSTVKWHIKQIYKKLNVRSRVQAIVKARELNLIVDGFVSDTTSSLGILPEPENPYKGLRAFQAADEKDFHGRDRLLEKLLSRLDSSEENNRLLAVVGPSGSGKSSLVKAGLIPALWRGELPGSESWFIVDMIPGAHPIEELETALTRIAAEHGANIGEYLRRNENGLFRIPSLILPDENSELLVVIDQFEEIFTLVEDETARLHFLDLLVTAITEKRSRVRVVLTLRADFYDRPLRYAEFGALLQNRVETLLPLSADELERAIVEPARRVGVVYEDGLVTEIIEEMLYQPGMLPLVQYALTELFETRQERLLMLEGYREVGGAVGALGKRAEEIFLEQTEDGQELVRQIFLRLVTLGEGREDTRRRTPQAELLAITENPDLADEIIDTFANYRLFSLDHDPETRVPTVEVAHEAILREWERLREWLDESREDIRQERLLARAAQDWARSDQEPSFLLRGARLERVQAWREKTDLRLTGAEDAFLEASLAAWDEELAEEATRMERERMLEQRSQTILRTLVGVFLVATIVAIGLTVFAFNQRGLAQNSAEAAQAEADARATQQSIAEAAQEEAVIQASLALEAQQEAENQAEIAAANEAEALAQKAIVVAQAEAAQRQADINQSRFLAAQSQLALNGDLRDLAVALARAAVNIEDPPGEAQTALSEAAYAPGIYRLFSVSSDQFLVARYRPDRKTLISISEDLAIQHWDIQTGILLRSIEIQVHPRQSYLLSHEHYLEERIFYLPDWSKSVDLSPDGTRALIGLSDLSLALVDVDTGEILKLMKGHTILIGVAVFSPDGRWALSSSYPGHGVSPGPGSDLSMRLWDLETGLEVRRFNGHADWISALAFSPDGKTAISGSIDETAIYWDLESGEPLQHMVNPSDPVEERYVNAAVFSPNGKLALISQWWSANLWDLDTGELIRAYEGHNQTIRELAFSPDGTLGVSGHGGEVWVFDIETGKVLEYFQHRGVAKDLIFNADGRSIIVAGADVYIFQLNQGPEIARFEVAAAMPASGVPDATYSPDGRKILATSVDGPLYYWDLESQQEILRIELPFRAREVAFTPNGDSALVTFWDGNVILFDLTSGAEIMRLGGDDNPLRHQDSADAVAISPDGTKALTGAQSDPPLIMWDLTTGEPIMELPSDMVFAVAFSPNGKTVLSAGFDLILWDAATGEMIRKLDNKDDANGHSNFIWDVVYSPDGTRALTGSWDATLILWDLETGEIIHQLLGHSDIVRAVAIHPDGRLAVSGSRDGTLIMWDLETGEAIRRIHAHNEVNSVEFSPDGQTILSGGFDLMVVVWRVDETLEDLIAWTDANRYTPELTCAERALYNVEPLCEAGE